MAKTKKTNAMRMLDRAKIDYETNTYEVTEKHQHGEQIAKMVGANVEEVYKTLVLENANHEHFVFVIPVNASLDMKQAAHVVNEKKLNLMPLDQLKQVTGYVRGGCSPIGMKHLFKTTIDRSAQNLDKIYVSGGQRGMQIIIKVEDLIKMTEAQVAHITHD
ncbi:Cys-tRNA(Pro) deacylase [Staphylococcus caprae]|uniref:Cys-tRNA(Pro)/Cys-tRNA(Cys) deacylase n=1 Tax=Staphylococcus caprae TaxID=29380 RepID=A0ABM7FUY5_9STAP|nr:MULTISPECIES: Cys-tRNA(Pro) deacylase [Staphylococcus]EES41014.1 YbaK/EbsC protein [Staphylococcus caprae M23864:W1]MBN6824871.1 Cys-tRNA(Pro) deacylase [Staphylococcus caprae]MBX5322143.1 Cys-tRNA(Pro) deacylase [Staphylococcus caprae]MDI0015005.1 Cys-tRNA(Pro) deacylase [Staphylococcus caprae]MEB8093733.1 Cys-tRNA(Pro) deacylase [Staphylococcus caprae]